MPYGKNQYGLLFLFETIEGHVTRPPTGYDQFSQIMLDWTTNERVAFQQRNCFFNQSYRFNCGRWIALEQEIGEPFKIGKSPFRIAQLRQDPAFGFAAFLPAIRALR